MKPLSILYILPALDGGGIDKIIYDYSMRLIDDGHAVDFVVSSEQKGVLEDALILKGCKIFHITQMAKDLRCHCNEFREILKSKKYDIVHDNSSYRSYFNLKVAKKCGVNCRIAHSHSAMLTLCGMDSVKKKIFSLLTKTVATDLFSCGTKAAQWTWENSKSFILPNAVDVSVFSFSEEKRHEYKQKYGLTNKKVIGIVARLSEEKNHIFLFDVFKIIKQRIKNVSLMVVGTGPLESMLKNYVRQTQLEDDVLFTGIRTDVADLINLFDIFVLPSFYEGVPVTIIEAQANGLACLLSDSITKEICFNKNVQYLSLTEPKEVWGDWIISMMYSLRDNSEIRYSNYNMGKAYYLLLDKYNELVAK